jgi:hypothetical protein
MTPEETQLEKQNIMRVCVSNKKSNRKWKRNAKMMNNPPGRARLLNGT